MLYATHTTHSSLQLRVEDRRARYRGRSGDQDSDTYASRAQAFDASARWQRITELNARLVDKLNPDDRALWQALEEALHVHWLDVAVDHYNRGYTAGRAQAWADITLAERASPRERLRALATALSEVVDALEKQQQ